MFLSLINLVCSLLFVYKYGLNGVALGTFFSMTFRTIVQILYLQKNILSAYPTLMRPINLRKQRFNEQATTGSMILECGTSGNTIQEAEVAIRAFGKKLAEQLTQE